MPRTPAPPTFADRLRWAYATLRREARQYEATPRPMTARRLLQSLAPIIRRPVFIVGAPRSGTSFLGRCIGALPELSYHFEPAATKAASQYVYTGQWAEARAARVYRTTYRWLLRIHADGDLRFAEKTPRNCFLIAFLRRTFPAAQFVHIVRDGRDAALSHSKKPWMQASAEDGEPGYAFGADARFWVEEARRVEFEQTSDYHRCIWAWRRHVESVLAEAPQLSDAQYHLIRYERFVQQPASEADRLLDFLGIEASRSRDRLHAVARRAHADSVGAWRTELTVAQRRTAEAEAGDLLRQLGYLKAEGGG